MKTDKVLTGTPEMNDSNSIVVGVSPSEVSIVPDFKVGAIQSRVPIQMMIPKKEESILIPPTGAREVRNDCTLKAFKYGSDNEICKRMTISILGLTYGYGSLPPLKTPNQIFKAFTNPQGKKPSGYKKDWFVFDDSNQVTEINPKFISEVLDAIEEKKYLQEWVLLWFVPLDNFGAYLKPNVMCFMPIKSGSIWHSDFGFNAFLDTVAISQKPIWDNPVSISFDVTHSNPSGGDVYGVAFDPLENNPELLKELIDSGSIQSTQPAIYKWLQDSPTFPLPEVAEQMLFRSSYAELEFDFPAIQEEMRAMIHDQLMEEGNRINSNINSDSEVPY